MALATRIIPVLLNKRGALVKGRKFNHGRVIGHTLQAIRVYQARDVDELIYLDVAASEPDFSLISQFATECMMPLTVGGGVRTLDHFGKLIQGGADKVSINTAAYETPELISEASRKFGSQAVVISLDVKNGTIWTHSGRHDTGRDAASFARDVAELGAGEILLNSIDRDGTLSGYDTELIRSVSRAVSIPVIACGGAGNYEDLRLGLEAGAHAVAAGALWSFCDATPASAAEYLASHGVPVRRRIAA
jgi:cyclase